MFHSPSRIFGAFVLALLAALLLSAALSPLVQWLLQAVLGEIPALRLHKVFNRMVQVLALALLAWLMFRQRLVHRALLGYERPGRRFLRRLGIGLLLGAALMALALLPLFVFGLREWKPGQLPADWPALVFYFIDLVRIGLVIAFVEETLFRGAMQGALERAGARDAALFAVPALYAAVHFFGEAVRIPDDQVTLLSGFTVLSGYFSLFRDPARIWDAFVALYAVGLLLALVRFRTGGIATCIGLHAGFAAVITLMRRNSLATAHGDWSRVVSAYDGLLGLWIAALGVVACVLLWRLPRRDTT
jgi:hypothetical protein